MTDKKISTQLQRIAQCKRNKYTTEALINSYHLNAELLKFIFLKTTPDYEFENKKFKSVVKDFQKQLLVNAALKSAITKQSVKSLKVWLAKMDTFFKVTKSHPAGNTLQLLHESEKICAILMISTKKIASK